MAEAQPNVDLTALFSPPTPTQEQSLAAKRQQFAAEFGSALQQQFEMRKQGYMQLYYSVWRNPALTPKQACIALGDKLATVFTASSLEAQHLNAIVPGSVPVGIPEGYTITFKPDGSLLELTEITA